MEDVSVNRLTLRMGKMNDYVAWFDGACGPVNPGGKATSGAIIKGKEGTVLLVFCNI